MDETIAILLGMILLVIIIETMHVLANDRWQFLAAMPIKNRADGTWQSINLTFYGLIIAISNMASLAAVIFMVASASVSAMPALLVYGLILVTCIPASTLVNLLIQGHSRGFTVAGAAFTGLLLAPLLTGAVNLAWQTLYGIEIPVNVILAALAVAYVLGEGLGRLACISFGCCYGKPLAGCSPWVKNIFQGWTVRFSSPTKKAVYESGFAGSDLIPIQALTAILYTMISVTGLYLFLKGFFTTAFSFTLIMAFAWRFISEFLRADYRGKGILSRYQIMSLAAVPCVVLIALLSGNGDIPKPDAMIGFQALWSPGILLFIEGIGIIVFLVFGISTVSNSTIHFHIQHNEP